MKIMMFAVISVLLIHSYAYALSEKVLYTGDPITVKVTPERMTIIGFPEPIIKMVKGVGMKNYHFVEGPHREVFMVTYSRQSGEAIAIGRSGTNYMLHFVISEEYHEKLMITDLSEDLAQNQGYLHFVDSQPPSMTTVTPQDSLGVESSGEPVDPYEQLPASLNSTVSLSGVNMPLKVYLNAISRMTGHNIIMSKGVQDEPVSVTLSEVELWRALKTLLYPLSYGFKISNKDIIILAQETRIFTIRMPAFKQSFRNTTTNSQRSQSSGSQNSSNGAGDSSGQDIAIGTSITMEHAASELSLWSELENNLANLITPGQGTYSLNAASGTLVVSDLPGVLDKIGVFIDQINQSTSRQQAFEIQIVEVRLNDAFEMGVDFNALAGNLKGLDYLDLVNTMSSGAFESSNYMKITTAGPKEDSGVNSNGVRAVLKALETMGKVEVISKPSITCTNMIPCVIQEGTQVSYLSGIGSVVNDNSTQLTVETNQLHEGIIMGILPKIPPGDEETVLNLSASVSSIDSIETLTTGAHKVQIPQVSLKSISTTVSVRPNEAVIIGGLISSSKVNSSRGVPGLSRIPLIGRAFSYESKQAARSELVIIIAPKAKFQEKGGLRP